MAINSASKPSTLLPDFGLSVVFVDALLVGGADALITEGFCSTVVVAVLLSSGLSPLIMFSQDPLNDVVYAECCQRNVLMPQC